MDTTHRFNTSIELKSLLQRFSEVHSEDDVKTFNDQWEIWIEENKELIQRENSILKEKGYKKDIYQKLYLSARYYFKNKKSDNGFKNSPTKRRKYCSIGKPIIKLIDEHLNSKQHSKPSVSFKNFLKENESLIIDEKNKIMLDKELEEKMFDNKLKKTYKNRYYVKFNKQREMKDMVK
jgi:hypothetical protein